MFYFHHKAFSIDAKSMMKRRFMSYRDLSRETKIPHASLWRMLDDPTCMDVTDMMRIVNALGLNPFKYLETEEAQLEMFRL